MSQLHLHVISQDFDSPSLKTKKHWNSFTSEYFVDSKDVITKLQQEGVVNYDRAKYEGILKRDLICHKCAAKLKTMPSLKEHLKMHL